MHPLAEYPRPAMRRDSCEILNGPWQYAITQTAEYPAAWQGSILVPYSPEAPASGVGRTLQPGQWLHYHRLFAPPAGEGGRVLLHFGAVDYACAVQVNGHLAVLSPPWMSGSSARPRRLTSTPMPFSP